VWTQNQLVAGRFHVFDGAGSGFKNGVHIELAFAVGLERIVVAVDEESSPGKKPGIHAHAFAGVHFNHDKAFPLIAIPFSFRFQFFEKRLFELKNLLDVHAGDQGLGGGHGSIGEEDVLKLIVAGRQDRGTLVDLGGVKEIEHGEVLNGEDAIHALKAEATLAIEEVGDVGLLETRLLCQAKAGEVAFVDALPESVAEIILQDAEFHDGGSIAWNIAMR